MDRRSSSPGKVASLAAMAAGDDYFLQRYTPRRRRSNWSRINLPLSARGPQRLERDFDFEPFEGSDPLPLRLDPLRERALRFTSPSSIVPRQPSCSS